MDLAQIAIYISLAATVVAFISAIIAAISLGWNIHRDTLKPQLKVRFMLHELFDFEEGPEGPPFLAVTATNHGPGKIRIETLFAKQSSLLKKIRRRERLYLLKPDFENPSCSRLPYELEVGYFVLRYHEECFLNYSVTHVGVIDSFGRHHWAPRKDTKRARGQFLKDKKKGFGD